MTGFGRGIYENEGREYIAEIKSVNNRLNDINIKMPRNLNYLEEKIRKQILNNISRGKVEVSIQLNNNSDLGKKINLNTDIAKRYIEELAEELQVPVEMIGTGVLTVLALCNQGKYSVECKKGLERIFKFV